MARLPGPEALGVVQARSPGVRRAPGSAIPGALKNLGDTITNEANKDSDLALRLQRKKKAEDDTLDSARANADWNTRYLNELSQYDPQKKPDYSKWGKEAETNLPKHREAAAQLIRDPKRRELFMLQTQDDLTRGTLNVREKAQGIDSEKRLNEGIASLDQQLALAAAPGMDEVQSNKIIAQTRTTIDNMVKSGLMTPGKAIEVRQNFAQKFSFFKAVRDKEDNPEQALRWLNGSGNTIYYNKLRKQESGGSDTIKAPTSSATGRYQFTESTWEAVRKAHPELALTANGRTSGDQQELAIRAFTADNAKALKDNGFPPSEANLYLAHFMGAGGAIKALTANQNASAAELFPDAASANKTVFFNKNGSPRSIGEVVALQTKNFSGQSGPAPEYYALLAPQDRIQLASAAEGEWARRDTLSQESTKIDQFNMQNSIVNDVSQLELTGQPTDLTPESVTNTLGEVQAAKWLEARAIAASTFKESSDLETLTAAQIDERLKELKPKAGDPNFDQNRQVYEKVSTKASQLLELRKKDPSAAVATSALVKKAMEDFKPDDPQSNQNLVNARVQSQRDIGIADQDIMPISAEQADYVSKVSADENLPVDARIQSLVAMVSQVPDPAMQRTIFQQMVKAGVPEKMEVSIDAYMRGDVGASRRLFEAASLKDDGGTLKDIAPSTFSADLQTAMFADDSKGQAFYGLGFDDPGMERIAARDFELAKTAALMAMRDGKDQTTAIDQALKDIMGDVVRLDERFQTQSGVMGVVPPDTDTVSLTSGMENTLPDVRKAIVDLKGKSMASLPKDADAGMKAIFESTHTNNIENLMEEGVFRAIGKGWGFYDPYSNAFVPGKDGEILTWTTEELVDIGKKKPVQKKIVDPGAVGVLPVPPATGMFGAPQ